MNDEKILGVRLVSGEEIHSQAVVLAVGGKAVPQTGCTGDGYPWAEKAGHTITNFTRPKFLYYRMNHLSFRKNYKVSHFAMLLFLFKCKRQNTYHASNGHVIYTFRT